MSFEPFLYIPKRRLYHSNALDDGGIETTHYYFQSGHLCDVIAFKYVTLYIDLTIKPNDIIPKSNVGIMIGYNSYYYYFCGVPVDKLYEDKGKCIIWGHHYKMPIIAQTDIKLLQDEDRDNKIHCINVTNYNKYMDKFVEEYGV